MSRLALFLCSQCLLEGNQHKRPQGEESLEMSIEDWRIEIDEIDEQIIGLLNRRARLAIKVGTLKKTCGLEIFDAERERKVINRMMTVNTGPLDERSVTKIFRRIIRESRRVEIQALAQQTPSANGVLG